LSVIVVAGARGLHDSVRTERRFHAKEDRGLVNFIQRPAGPFVGADDAMTPLVEATWPGWSPEKTLVLPIPPEVWMPPVRPVELDGVEFRPKDELHVTLVGRTLGRQLHDTLGERFRTCAVRAAFEALDWRYTRTGEYLRLEKTISMKSGEARPVGAIIERLSMPAMKGFHRALGDLLGRKLAVPPPHVTLYTFNRDDGIGIPGPSKLRAWTVRRVREEELAAAEVMVS